jgi:hypothetical protein
MRLFLTGISLIRLNQATSDPEFWSSIKGGDPKATPFPTPPFVPKLSSRTMSYQNDNTRYNALDIRRMLFLGNWYLNIKGARQWINFRRTDHTLEQPATAGLGAAKTGDSSGALSAAVTANTIYRIAVCLNGTNRQILFF